ncbi:MAG TPA: GNAT family N-acetyltransferase [Woeseiaceae bacterium]|nr:GNAT family N-acetyltransferase [Woeseiaceae bacterium]
MAWRDRPRAGDREAVRRLVECTGFFSAAEVEVAVELVDDALVKGDASEYRFLFADARGGELAGYACYGPAAPGGGRWDLYWIAVAPGRQRGGLGRRLLAEAERRALAGGATEMTIDTAGRAQYAPTRAFYERMGYAVLEVVPDFYSPGDDKVAYRKRLA